MPPPLAPISPKVEAAEVTTNPGDPVPALSKHHYDSLPCTHSNHSSLCIVPVTFRARSCLRAFALADPSLCPRSSHLLLLSPKASLSLENLALWKFTQGKSTPKASPKPYQPKYPCRRRVFKRLPKRGKTSLLHPKILPPVGEAVIL